MDWKMEQVDRIQQMEIAFDKVTNLKEELCLVTELISSDSQEIQSLQEYLESGLWMEDYAADEEGKLPQELKRGVLSEDGLYNLLTDLEEVKRKLGSFLF